MTNIGFARIEQLCERRDLLKEAADARALANLLTGHSARDLYAYAEELEISAGVPIKQ